MTKLIDLTNIGMVLEKKLVAVGITGAEELLKLGSREAFMRIKLQHPDTCVNTLYALEGAVHNIRWGQLPPHKKAEIKQFWDENFKTGGDSAPCEPFGAPTDNT